MTSSFPNLLLLGGPNTTTLWASLIRGLELQAAYNLRIIKHIRECLSIYDTYSLEPRPEREAEWTESMQPELNQLCTNPKYGSSFRYINAQKRNTHNWPWTQQYYWWRTRTFIVSDYIENYRSKKAKSL